MSNDAQKDLTLFTSYKVSATVLRTINEWAKGRIDEATGLPEAWFNYRMNAGPDGKDNHWRISVLQPGHEEAERRWADYCREIGIEPLVALMAGDDVSTLAHLADVAVEHLVGLPDFKPDDEQLLRLMATPDPAMLDHWYALRMDFPHSCPIRSPSPLDLDRHRDDYALGFTRWFERNRTAAGEAQDRFAWDSAFGERDERVLILTPENSEPDTVGVDFVFRPKDIPFMTFYATGSQLRDALKRSEPAQLSKDGWVVASPELSRSSLSSYDKAAGEISRMLSRYFEDITEAQAATPIEDQQLAVWFDDTLPSVLNLGEDIGRLTLRKHRAQFDLVLPRSLSGQSVQVRIPSHQVRSDGGGQRPLESDKVRVSDPSFGSKSVVTMIVHWLYNTTFDDNYRGAPVELIIAGKAYACGLAPQ